MDKIDKVVNRLLEQDDDVEDKMYDDHEAAIKKEFGSKALKTANIGWSFDEMEDSITSKVGKGDDVYHFTTWHDPDTGEIIDSDSELVSGEEDDEDDDDDYDEQQKYSKYLSKVLKLHKRALAKKYGRAELKMADIGPREIGPRAGQDQVRSELSDGEFFTTIHDKQTGDIIKEL